MSIYIYAPKLYPGTAELIAALNGKRLVKHDGMRFLNKGTPIEFSTADTIICWGQHVPPIDGVLTLNTSYSFTSQVRMNITMGRINFASGYAVVPITKMLPVVYAAELAKLQEQNNIVKKCPLQGHIPYEEFVGYGSRFYKFEKHAKVAIFNNKPLSNEHTPEEVIAAKTVTQYFGLLFGVVSVSHLGGISVVRKVLTAPSLNNSDVELVAAAFINYIKQKQEINNAIIDMANLL